ncbi:MAG: RNA polymerase sigma factor [Burkholderiales bacterium]
MTPDAALSRSIANGDTKAFALLMRRHNRTLFRTARAILRDDAAAEDALQEAWLRAYRAMDTFRGEAKLATWLLRIVVNEALARLRKEQRQVALVALAPEAEEATRRQDEPEGMAQRSDLRRRLEARIRVLPDAFRAVFLLRAVQELSVEETAAALRIPESTVRTRFFRARSQLREALS